MKLLKIDPTRALVLYSGLVTAALLWVMLTGAAAQHNADFDTLTVHRINVRESDGTLRLVISSRDHFPGAFAHGKEISRPDRNEAAGLLFLNDEGTENGGLIFAGRKVNGKVESFGHLSFDQYDQDQVINLEEGDEDGQHYGGLAIHDYPDAPLDFDLPQRLQKLTETERKAQIDKLKATGAFGQPRGFFGKSENRDALLSLRDGAGRTRLQLRVTLAGTASIEFLDETGKVVRTVTPQEVAPKDGSH
jgi:hypothetical protein